MASFSSFVTPLVVVLGRHHAAALLAGRRLLALPGSSVDRPGLLFYHGIFSRGHGDVAGHVGASGSCSPLVLRNRTSLVQRVRSIDDVVQRS